MAEGIRAFGVKGSEGSVSRVRCRVRCQGSVSGFGVRDPQRPSYPDLSSTSRNIKPYQQVSLRPAR